MTKSIDRWETRYISKWDGSSQVHVNTHNKAAATEWTRQLAQENNCKAECVVVYKDGTSEHIESHGSKKTF